MADRQPEDAVAPGDEDEMAVAKSAEDRKAAAALSKLDARGDDDEAAAAARDVDHEAVSRAMDSLGSGGGSSGKKADDDKKAAARKVKVDAADVALIVDELDLNKAKATELLKAHDGDAVKAMRAYVAVP